MRVLLSGYTCDPNGGSEAANTWYTALELARAGAEVHLLTRESDRAGVVDELRRAAHERLPLTATFLSDRVPRAVSTGQLGVYARYGAFQRRVRNWAQNHGGWDVGHHVSWGSVNHPVGLAGVIHPLVVGPAGGGQLLPPELVAWVDGRLSWNHLRNFSVRHPGINPSARRIAGEADLVLVANRESGEMVRRLGAVNTELMVPEGVRRAINPRVRMPARPTIVWLGRFLPIKGARLALAAFREIRQSVPEARLVFVGDGPCLRQVRAEATDLNEREVIFAGAQPWERAQEQLANARVHLFTALRDSSSAQTLEAAALGIPTVGLDTGGLAGQYRHPGFRLVPVSSAGTLPGALGQAVARVLLMDSDAWVRQSVLVQQFADSLRFSARARDLLRVYRGL